MALEMQVVTYEWGASGSEVGTHTDIDVVTVAEYLPASPPLDVVWSPGARVGASPVQHGVQNVVEQVRIIANSSPFTLLGNLKRVLRRAQFWAEKNLHDRRVMVRIRDTSRSTTWYEARLWGGSVRLERGPYLTLQLVRQPYWDGPEALVQVRVEGGSWANSATVMDRDDATGKNRIEVNDVAGDVPSPARIIVEDDYATRPPPPYNLGELRIGWDLAQYTVNIEGENSLLMPAVTSSTAYSANAYGTDFEFMWAVAVQYIGPYKLLAKGNLSGQSWTATMLYDNALYSGEMVSGANGWTDLGVFMLPPGGQLHPQRKMFYIKLVGTGNGDLDYLMLMPVSQFRKLNFVTVGDAAAISVQDDGWWGEAAVITTAGRSPEIQAYGRPISLWPAALLPDGKHQMLVFTQEGKNGAVASNRTARVSVYARPRYEVLP